MQAPASYFDQSDRDDVLSGGVKMIPISTPKGDFRVWTKRTGNNPTVKVLLLHGGPGATHEYFEACDSYFPAAGIEYSYYYDQLGSTYSDQPDDPDRWEIPQRPALWLRSWITTCAESSIARVRRNSGVRDRRTRWKARCRSRGLAPVFWPCRATTRRHNRPHAR